jgi:hypothetical protein
MSQDGRGSSLFGIMGISSDFSVVLEFLYLEIRTKTRGQRISHAAAAVLPNFSEVTMAKNWNPHWGFFLNTTFTKYCELATVKTMDLSKHLV